MFRYFRQRLKSGFDTFGKSACGQCLCGFDAKTGDLRLAVDGHGDYSLITMGRSSAPRRNRNLRIQQNGNIIPGISLDIEAVHIKLQYVHHYQVNTPDNFARTLSTNLASMFLSSSDKSPNT